jgi:hypothetical protein
MRYKRDTKQTRYKGINPPPMAEWRVRELMAPSIKYALACLLADRNASLSLL